MYSRNYTEDTGRILIPEGYEGTALVRDTTQNEADFSKHTNDSSAREESCAPITAQEEVEAASAGSFLGTLPFGDLFSGLFSNKKFKLSSFGFEEILIGTVAIYLLFSKNADIECAIMLIILLFIS